MLSAVTLTPVIHKPINNVNISGMRSLLTDHRKPYGLNRLIADSQRPVLLNPMFLNLVLL